jgi:hypothetical protein
MTKETQPIELNGTWHVDARWIEKEYNLSRCKCRRTLLASNLEYTSLFNRFFYKQAEIEEHFEKLNLKKTLQSVWW